MVIVDSMGLVNCTSTKSGLIRLKVTGGTPPYQYGLNSQPPFQSSPIFQGLMVGNYFVLVIDSLGCTGITPVIILPAQNSNSNSKIHIGMTSKAFCPGIRETFEVLNSPSGYIQTYQWYINGIKQAGGDSAIFYSSNLKNGDQVYLDYGTICTANNYSDTLMISLSTKPVVTLKTNANQICAGSPIQIQAISQPDLPGANYEWYVNSIRSSANTNVFVSSSLKSGDQIYCIQVPTTSTCFPMVISDTLSLSLLAHVQAGIFIRSSPDSVCQGSPMQFIAGFFNGGTKPQFQWYLNGNKVGPDDSIFTSNTLKLGDSIRCSLISSIPCALSPVNSNILYPYINPIPSLNLPSSVTVNFGNSIQINPQVIGTSNTYLWTPASGIDNPSSPSPNIPPLATTTYRLKVTNSNGCSDTASITINVVGGLQIPNAFSPNGEGINDTWSISSLEETKDITVDIYNRFGQILFHSKGYSQPWDGTYNGKYLPFGTYYYLINFNNGTKPLSGYLTLIR